MPEISLKEYYAKLNSLLSANAVDEVVHHCSHILEYFPKNVTAYRLLGRALVMSGRWDEGREALRRVLSVIPDDFVAHLGLSEASEHMDRPDEAIWHLERAFEQRPNDKELIDALRALYSQHRNIQNLKIQLTSATVARQYLRSGAYTQAIDTLRSALTRMNERLDLKLLLAQILWQHGSQEEAAEIALEVLGVLPDCLEANKIMAQLWLSVNRPSDAQRYVNRLEAVDPYLAVEVAQGYSPEDDVFRINELDYVHSAQSEMANARPDWLQEISTLPAPAVETEKEQVGNDWSDWASAMLSTNKPADQPKKPPADQPTSTRFAAMAQDDEPAGTGLTGFFGRPEDADADELSALFGNSGLDEEDPMAWMREAGVEIVNAGEEEPSYESLLAAEEEDSPLEIDENPMAWLRDDDDDLLLQADRPMPQASGEDDPFAWMTVTAGDEPANAPSEPAAEKDDSLAWLRDERLLDDALDLEGLNSGEQIPDWDTSISSAATIDGQDEMLENQTSGDAENQPSVPGPRRGLTAILQESNFDWVNKQEDAKLASEDEMDDWLNQFGASSEPKKAVTDNPDWLLELEQPQTGERDDQALTSEATEPESQFAVAAAEEEFAWMSDDRPAEPAQSEGDSVDWLREFAPQPDAEPAAGDDFAWTTEESPKDDELEAAETPDWLSELKPEQDADEDDSAAMSDEPSAEAEEEAEPDWLSELEPEQDASEIEEPALSDFPWMAEESSTEEEPEAVAGDVPDWLSALEPEQDAADVEPAAEMSAGDDIAWMTDAAEEAEAVAGDVPDWLSELEPKQEISDAEPAAEAPALDEFPWMTDEVLAETNEQPEVIDSEFTWMTEDSQAEAEEEAEAVAGDIPDWLTELAPEEAEAAVEEAPAAETVMPWIADHVPELAAAAVAEDEFDWMTEDSLAEAEEQAEAVAGDVPDWLSELEPEQEAEAVAAEAEPVAADDDLAWLDEEAEPEAVASDVPDWLSEPEAEQEPEAVTAEAEPVSADTEFAWLDEDEEEQPETIASEPAASEWMPVPAEAAYDEEDEALAEIFGDEFDSLDEFDEEEEEVAAFAGQDEFLEPTPAHNAPDWLNAMVPGLDVDYEPGEDELVEEEFEEPAADSTQREYAWLTEMVEEEMAAVEHPSFAFSSPPSWMGSHSAFLEDDGMDDDLPDWPSDDADADIPEWLR